MQLPSSDPIKTRSSSSSPLSSSGARPADATALYAPTRRGYAPRVGMPDSNDDLSDADLARWVAEGAPDASRAEAELCRRFARRVRSYGLRHLRSDDAADELVQRVLMLVVVKLRQGAVRDLERIASFTLGTARTCVQTWRRSEPETEPLDDEGPWHVAPESTRALDRQRVVACLNELADRERSVIALSFFEGFTAAEISKSFGISAGNVRVMRHRALASLRQCVQQKEMNA